MRDKSYPVERHWDRGYSSDQGLVGEVGLVVDSHLHNHIVVGSDDRTGVVKVETLKLPIAIRNLSVL